MKRIILAAALFTLIATPAVAQNVILNGDFSRWLNGPPNGTTTTNQIETADRWFFGPGVGATADYYRVPHCYPCPSVGVHASYLGLHWRNSPAWATDPNDPSGGQTFLEHPLSNHAAILAGKTVHLSFHAWTSSGHVVQIAPIIWIAWDAMPAYTIVTCPPAVLDSTHQTVVSCVLTVPQTGGAVNSSHATSNEVGIGVDLMAPAPAGLTVWFDAFALELL